MAVKISELPTGDALDGTESIPVVQGGGTIKATIDEARNYIAAMPVATFDNSSFPQTLNNWGLWDADNACGELNDVTLVSAVTFTGKMIIIRNTTASNMTLAGGNLIDLDGTAIAIIGQNRSMIAVSNGTDWLMVAQHAV